MSPRQARGVAGAFVFLTLASMVWGTSVPLLNGLAWPLSRGFSWSLAVPFCVVGALIAVRHPGNAIGWLFLAVAFSVGFAEAAQAHAEVWVHRGGNDTLGNAAALYADLSWIPFILVPATFLLLLFPDGRLLSRWWRPVAWCAALGIAGVFVMTALTPGRLQDFPQVTNPYGWSSPLFDPLMGLSFALLFVGSIGSAASLIVRFRRSVGERRLQMQWLAFAGAVAAVIVPVSVLGYEVWGEVVANSAIMLSILLLPVAAGMAILRYRLYDIDVIVNRTLVYGALTALLALFYLATVVLLQGLLGSITADSHIATAGSTLAVAAAFRPLRSRVQGFIDRRFYRRKYDAAQTLDAFSARLRDQVDLDSMGRELVAVVGATMQPAHASLWLRSAPRGAAMTAVRILHAQGSRNDSQTLSL